MISSVKCKLIDHNCLFMYIIEAASVHIYTINIQIIIYNCQFAYHQAWPKQHQQNHTFSLDMVIELKLQQLNLVNKINLFL